MGTVEVKKILALVPELLELPYSMQVGGENMDKAYNTP